MSEIALQLKVYFKKGTDGLINIKYAAIPTAIPPAIFKFDIENIFTPPICASDITLKASITVCS